MSTVSHTLWNGSAAVVEALKTRAMMYVNRAAVKTPRKTCGWNITDVLFFFLFPGEQILQCLAVPQGCLCIVSQLHWHIFKWRIWGTLGKFREIRANLATLPCKVPRLRCTLFWNSYEHHLCEPNCIWSFLCNGHVIPMLVVWIL